MDIIGHLIQDTEIIGIGPLYAEPTKDLTMQSLYNSFRYFFDVHCRQRSIRIESDYFKPAQSDELKRLNEKKRYNDWKEEYNRVRKLIAEQIGEIIPEQK